MKGFQMATSSKSKQANAAVEAHSALTNRMANAQQVLESTLTAALETQTMLTEALETQAMMTAAFETQVTLISQFMAAQGFWESDNTGEKSALTHSESSEAPEADRKDLEAENIPGFTDVEEELADAVIRILDFAGHHNPRFGEALSTKIAYNLTCPFKHGKAY